MFLSVGIAEAHPILCKYSESREQNKMLKTKFSKNFFCRGASLYYVNIRKINEADKK